MTFFAKNFVSLENWGEILERKSNSPIVVILKIRLRIIVRANAR